MPSAINRSATAAETAAPLRHWLRLVLLGLGISAVPLDTAVNIAFPDITRSFDLPIPMIQWVIICYVLTHAGLMLAFGRVGDIWSHAQVFRAGLAWSALAFVLCALAPSFGWLLFFRFLQGIGAGLIISCAPALVTGMFPERRRSHALGLFTLMFALGSAVGPLIGGVLVAQGGWPGVFWFRAPICLVALLGLRGLPEAERRSAGERFDLFGAALLALGLASLLLAFNRLPHGTGGAYQAAALVVVAAAGFVGFVWWEGRAARPIVRIALFRDLRFAAINLASVLLYLTTFSVMLLAPYYLVRFTSLPLPLAGAVLAAGFIAMAAFSPFAGAIVARVGAARVAPLGAAMAGAGLGLVALWQGDTGAAAMVAGLALQGVGMGLFQVAYMELVMAAAPADPGVAGSLSMLTRTVGVVIAAALLTLVFQAIETAAAVGGAAPAAAFLAAFRAVFAACAGLSVLTGAALLWSAREAPR